MLLCHATCSAVFGTQPQRVLLDFLSNYSLLLWGNSLCPPLKTLYFPLNGIDSMICLSYSPELLKGGRRGLIKLSNRLPHELRKEPTTQ